MNNWGCVSRRGSVLVASLAICLGVLIAGVLSVSASVPFMVNTVVGFGIGDGFMANIATIDSPNDVAVDAVGNIYIADTDNHVIRKIDWASGMINTVAGSGAAGYSGDGGPATQAHLSSPGGISVTPSGDIFIADTFNHVVRFVNSTNGIITTVAGTGIPGSSLGGGDPLLAELNNPDDVEAVPGAVFIADTFNERILQIDSGIINVIAGTGIAGYSGEGLLSDVSMLNSPTSLHFLVAEDCLLIADSGNDIIRKVCGSDMLMNTVAGTPETFSYTGDGGAATSATLDNPTGVAYDSARNYILIADTSNHAVRFINNSTGIINTLAG
ncbi:MAG: hypothetical protein KAR83_08020, partial [Thermodesulfovibrionales bacterium]|nr:hypothetical protein [Thermodesulfovibrionales bacterium]